MYIMIPLSAALIWLFSAPIHMFMTVQDWRLSLSSVKSFESKGFEYLEKNHCEKTDTNCQCVLLIHGLGDTSYTWVNTLKADKDSWSQPTSFYSINLPGAGKTKRFINKSDYGVNKMSEKIIDSLPSSCKKWHLVGNSFGAWIATKIAYLRPQIVSSLTLMGAAGLDVDYSHITEVFLSPSIEKTKKFTQLAYAQPPFLLDYIYKAMVERLKALPVDDMISAQTKEDFIDKDLKSISVPIYLLWGDKDRVCPLDYALRIKQIQPNANLEIAENCGHLPQKECFFSFQQALNQQLMGFH